MSNFYPVEFTGLVNKTQFEVVENLNSIFMFREEKLLQCEFELHKKTAEFEELEEFTRKEKDLCDASILARRASVRISIELLMELLQT